mgnify:CR=1 FL=1
MNIEIKTTSIKLSKSIINQMVVSSPSGLTSSECLGYVANIVKGSGKSLILRRDGQYYTFPCNWDKASTSIRGRTGGWTFPTEEACDAFWVELQHVISRAEQIYI